MLDFQIGDGMFPMVKLSAHRVTRGATIPYKSKAQQGFFNANRKKLEASGVDVDEWNSASKGKKLPGHVIAQAKKRASKS